MVVAYFFGPPCIIDYGVLSISYDKNSSYILAFTVVHLQLDV